MKKEKKGKRYSGVDLKYNENQQVLKEADT